MLKIAKNGLIWHYIYSFGFSWIFSASPPPPPSDFVLVGPPPIWLCPHWGPTGTENFESLPHQKFREKTLWCICFVNVRRFLPCGMIWSLSFKTKRGIVLTYQIIRKCLVWRLRKLSITMPLIFCFYILNFISIDANFRIIPHPFKHIKT